MKRLFTKIESLITEHIGTEKHELEGLYNTLDWLDIGLVVIIVLRFISMLPEDVADINLGSNPVFDVILATSPVIDITIGLISIALCATAFVVSAMLRRNGWISKWRLIARFFWWPLWIPIDLAFIGLSLVALFTS